MYEVPKGPQGQKRPADVIGNAVHVMRIATGQIEENTAAKMPKASRPAPKPKKAVPARRPRSR